jgi:hypothetical protein
VARRTMWAAAVGLVAMLGFTGWSLLRPSVQRYGSLRQVREEKIPGTLTFFLTPAPADFAPVITPHRAEQIGTTNEDQPSQITLSLALVRDRLGTTQGPAWVVISRGVCFAAFKGELVAGARSPQEDSPRCTDRNLWIEAVDATSGKELLTLNAYDISGTWRPTRGPA